MKIIRLNSESQKVRENFFELCVSCHRKYDITQESKEKISQYLTGKISPKRRKVYMFHDSKIIEFPSISIASKETKILKTSIINCLKGRSKKAGGFIWSYKNENNENI